MNGNTQRPRGCLMVVVLAVLLAWCGSLLAQADAATLTVDANMEADWDHNNVYMCVGAGCTVLQNNEMKQAVTMPKTTGGAKPSVVIDLAGKEGAVAVSAADASGNESGLSVPVPFDKKAPLTPVNPRLLP